MNCLENLPHLAFIEILKFLFHQDKLHLRQTSRRLYNLTTFCDAKFKSWSFDASRGTPPDFVIESDKMFSVYIDDKYQSEEKVESMSRFINTYAERISSLIIKKNSVHDQGHSLKFFFNMMQLKPKWNNLKEVKLDGYLTINQLDQLQLKRVFTIQKMELNNTFRLNNYPFQFSSLKCLTIRNIGHMMIPDAPRLEKMEIVGISQGFQIVIRSQLTNLKSLVISDCMYYIDLKNILNKSQTVEKLHLVNNGILMKFDKRDVQFPSLQFFKYNGSGQNLLHLMSQWCTKLISLDLELLSQVNLGSFVNKNTKMKLKTIKLKLRKGTKNVVKFLNSCDDLISLELIDYQDPLIGLNLPKLRTLFLEDCSADCIEALLSATCLNLKELTLQILRPSVYYNASHFLPIMSSLEFVTVTAIWNLDRILQQLINMMFRQRVEVELVSLFKRLIKRVNKIGHDIQAGCKRSEDAAGCKRSEDEAGCKRSEDEAGCKRSEDEAGCKKSKDEAGCKKSEDEAGCKRSEDEAGCKKSEDEAGCKKSENEAGCKKSENEAGCKRLEDEAGCKRSEDEEDQGVDRNKKVRMSLT